MKNKLIITTVVWLLALTAWAQGGLLVTGIVKDKETRRALANVNIAVRGTNIGTVTNADGVFSLKVSKEELSGGVVVSHLGYQNVTVSAETLTDERRRPVVWLTPTTMTLDMLNVYGGSPLALVEQAIRRVSQNYASDTHLFSAFYRETIQKRNRYIGVSEAVADVYKTDYGMRDVSRDRVQILKAVGWRARNVVTRWR